LVRFGVLRATLASILVVDLDEERADESDGTLASGPWTHAGRVVLLHPLRQLGFIRLNRSTSRPSTDARVVVARPGDCPAGSPGTLIGRTLARPTERVDPSQQRRSLEAGAVFAVDLWRFQAALATARRAQLDPAVAAALAEAGEAYGGVLLDGASYAWVEAPREGTRRRAVDALAHLAEPRQAAGDLEAARAALEQAVDADPVAEELYRRVMPLEAELGRPDAVRRTYRLLARRLADLDVDPDAETEQLVAELLRRPGA
jgi:hypothetical protein